MKWGYNFEMGPFEMWDAYGVADAVERMKAEGHDIPENVAAMLAAGNTCFYKLEQGKKYFYDFSAAAYNPVPMSKTMVSLRLHGVTTRLFRKTAPQVS